MDQTRGTVTVDPTARAADTLRYLAALHRDAKTAGRGSDAWDRWENELLRQMPALWREFAAAARDAAVSEGQRVMGVVADAVGMERPRG